MEKIEIFVRENTELLCNTLSPNIIDKFKCNTMDELYKELEYAVLGDEDIMNLIKNQ